jgi:hypothetical protein
MSHVYRSEALTIVGGSSKTVPLNFLRSTGPRGGRLEIIRVIIKGVITATTDGATSITAAGQNGWLPRIVVTDAKGDLWNLTGMEARAKHIAENGRFALADSTAVAVSTTMTNRVVKWCLDFAPRRAKRRWDYATPADSINRIELTAAAAGQVGTGSGLTSITQTYTVFVECREALRSTESKSRREVKSQTQAGTVDLRAGIFGGTLRSLLLLKAADHVTGGTDISSIGTVTCDALQLSQQRVDVLQNQFQQETENDPSSTTDPFVQSTLRALPIWWPTTDGKIPDQPFYDGEILVRLDANSVSNVVLLTDIIVPRDSRSVMAEARISEQAGHTGTKVKTANKTAIDPAKWGRYAGVMPMKATGGQE